MLDKRKLTVEAMLDELKEPVPMEFVEKFFGHFVATAHSARLQTAEPRARAHSVETLLGF